MPDTLDPTNLAAVFKAYDVRGLVPDQVDERLAHDDERGPSTDDLLALAEAVREAGAPRLVDATVATPAAEPEGVREVGRRGHLRVLRTED